ncbi:ATP-binding protein [Sphingobacterium sp. DN00404]|uniref:ATP-binding protein n=1 Tax=Sphingobacterium micropteri TaxID=2763501 RepID=A0ABR7YTK0_9SPHI|nr:ATP-binding protein [Sphingobacterium micropteri]MBD1434607.1 ATP-binding protein [Sphingobacterium micropteri]
MQIHFIWVNQYKSLRGKAINLSEQYIFKWQDSGQSGQDLPVLTITENPGYLPGFFGKDNVEGVSAVIGKNGAGKSTVLDYIKSHLPEGLEANVEYDVIAYSFIENGQQRCYILLPNGLDIKVVDEGKHFEPMIYGEGTRNEKFRWTGELSRAEYIYYSYFLDYNQKFENWKGQRNLSTGNLLQAERVRVMEENRDGQIQMHLLSETSDLESFARTEMARTIEFLNSEFAEDLPFDKPEELFITINHDDRLYFMSGNSEHPDVVELLEKLEALPKAKDVVERFMDNMAFALLINYLINERKYTINNFYRHPINFSATDSVKAFVEGYFATMSNAYIEAKGQQVQVTDLHKLAKSVSTFFEIFDEGFKSQLMFPYQESGNTLVLPLNDKTDAIFRTISSSYLKVKGISSFFDFSWRSLSSGEQSFLTMVSRFYHVRHYEHNGLSKELVILIDEGDAGYHPEWQRVFFMNTLDFLSKLFNGYQLQLIFAANTPFLTSDLPKANVLFIEQSEDRTSFFHSKDNDRVETFGANIHQLYGDSFYMDGVMIGAFAKRKIDEIIRYLGDGRTKRPNDDYKRTIELIGEPLLRRKLQQMWLEKFGLTEELDMLERKVKEIKRKLSQSKKRL